MFSGLSQQGCQALGCVQGEAATGRTQGTAEGGQRASQEADLLPGPTAGSYPHCSPHSGRGHLSFANPGIYLFIFLASLLVFLACRS